MQNRSEADIVQLTADIAEAYLTKNSVSLDALPELIASIHQALTDVVNPKPVEAEKPAPRVPIKKTVTPDFLISLEDGKRYKSLRRHLTSLGLTPDQYREKWGLPHDYPMVAPEYAQRRSEMAKALGLGRKRAEPQPDWAPALAHEGSG